MVLIAEECPHCGGEGKYIKNWDLKQRRQKKGGKKGEYETTGKVTKIRLFKCKQCRRNFRKGETFKDGNP